MGFILCSSPFNDSEWHIGTQPVSRRLVDRFHVFISVVVFLFLILVFFMFHVLGLPISLPFLHFWCCVQVQLNDSEWHIGTQPVSQRLVDRLCVSVIMYLCVFVVRFWLSVFLFFLASVHICLLMGSDMCPNLVQWRNLSEGISSLDGRLSIYSMCLYISCFALMCRRLSISVFFSLS